MALPAAARSHPPAITSRSILLGMATGALLNIYADYAGMILGSASLVKEQLPMSVLLPFVGWLGLNLLLRLVSPRIALSGRELLVIYSLSWIVGTLPASGWTAYWGGIVSAPAYYASPEKRWEELLFDVLPWRVSIELIGTSEALVYGSHQPRRT
jgi:hypothetical protein